jgi:WD40 repeat protein
MLRSRTLFCVFCPLAGLLLALAYFIMAAATPTSAQPAQPKGQLSFIKDVAPVLQKNCFGCHDAKKKQGKLDMTKFEGLLAGGRHDDVVVPGKSKDSYIITVLRSTTATRMPPREVGGPMPKDQIDLIAAWIDQGAKLDADVNAKADLYKELQKRWQPPALLAAYTKPALINSVTFSPDSKKVIASGYHELTVWDVASGKLEKRVHTRAERAHDMEFLPDGKLVVAGGRPGQEGDVRIYDIGGMGKSVGGVAVLDGVADKSVLVAQLIQTGDEMLTLDVSDDGKKIAAAGCDQVIRVWDISGGYAKAKLEHSVENHADWVLSVNFSPNGQFLITGSRDKSAKVWDLKAKESLVTFPGHAEPVFGAVLQTDLKAGISAGADKQIRWFNTQEKSKDLGKAIRNTGAHSKAIFKLVEYRKDKDHILATCSADGSVKTWNATNGSALKTFSGLKDWVYAVAISPDGKMVAAGSWDGEVRVWNLADAALVKGFNASPGYDPAKTTASK